VARPGEARRVLRLHLAVGRAGWTTRGSVDCAQSARALNDINSDVSGDREDDSFPMKFHVGAPRNIN
jgi:hypothetical protein